MNQSLGTQLRHLIELLDKAVAQSYDNLSLNYRPRYTPVFRALIELGTCTINDIATYAGITQPAATQTIKLMQQDNLIEVNKGNEDSRQRLISISSYGQSILPLIKICWASTNSAASSLDEDLGYSLSHVLSEVIEALSKKSFEERIAEANNAIQI